MTRHSSHADLTCRALEAGKAVFVEKPLALDHEQLRRILDTVAATGNDRLMVGFNRRFAPMLTEMRSRFGRVGPGTVVRYLVNAGSLSADSWYRNEDAEGTRFVGEGGHFIDTLSWWMGADPIDCHTVAGPDRQDLHVTLRYPGGSVGMISYLTNGHARFPKETFDCSSGGHSARLDNFKRATVWAGRRRRIQRNPGAPDKGQRLEVAAFIDAVRSGAPMPIPVASLAATTRATFAAMASATSGQAEPV